MITSTFQRDNFSCRVRINLERGKNRYKSTERMYILVNRQKLGLDCRAGEE